MNYKAAKDVKSDLIRELGKTFEANYAPLTKPDGNGKRLSKSLDVVDFKGSLKNIHSDVKYRAAKDVKSDMLKELEKTFEANDSPQIKPDGYGKRLSKRLSQRGSFKKRKSLHKDKV